MRHRRVPLLRGFAVAAAATLMGWGLLGGTTAAHAETTEPDLVAAFTSGGSFTLDNDMTTGPLVLDPGVSLDLDLAGHTLTITGIDGTAGGDGSAGLTVGGHLTVRDGEIVTTGGAGQPGAAGADGTAADPDGVAGADGTAGGPGLAVAPGAVLSAEGVSLRAFGGDGGTGGAGGAGSDGADAADLGTIDGTPGGDGGAGGAAGAGGPGMVNDNIIALGDESLVAASGAGGAGGAGGPGGRGGAGSSATGSSGAAGGDGGPGGAGVDARTAVVNNGTIVAGSARSLTVRAHGTGGAGGTAGPGGAGPGVGSDGPTGSDGSRGADGVSVYWVEGNIDFFALDGNGADDNQALSALAATLGDTIAGLDELVTPWPTRAGYVVDGWWSEASGGTPIATTDEPADQRIYVHWALPCTPATLAADLAGATDGDTITLCGDLVMTADDPPLVVPDGAAITLDLDGHGLTVADAGLHIGATSALTVRGGTVTIPDGATVSNDGALILDEESGAVIVNRGVIVNTGTVSNPDGVNVHNYLVGFDPNGGALGRGAALADQVRVFGPSLAADALPEVPTRDGYAFAGWSSAADGSGADLVDGDLTVLGNGPVTVTWYAQWTADPVEIPEPPAPAPPLADTGAPAGAAIAVALLLLTTGLALLRRGPERGTGL